MKKKICALHSCESLAKINPIINENEMYNICGKCLIELNKITVELNSFVYGDGIFQIKYPNIVKIIQ